MSHVKISITVNEDNLDLLDNNRGLATRSAYIDFIIEKEFSKKGSKKL